MKSIIKFTDSEKQAFKEIVFENAVYSVTSMLIKKGLNKVNNKNEYSEIINSVVAAGTAYVITISISKLVRKQ